jgi:hypothetical protein
MRIRTILASAVAALGFAVSTQASTLTVTLKTTDTGQVVTDSQGKSAHVFTVDVYAKSNQAATSAGGDGGFSGFQFDILSQANNVAGSGFAIPEVQAGPPGKAKTTFNVPGFTTLTPNRVDADATNGYAGIGGQPADTDTDLDSIGGSFFDAGNTSNTFNLGQDQAANGGLGYRVATETWDGNASDFLQVFVKGAQYYDFTNDANNFHTDFTSVVANGAFVTIPEPASLGLLVGLVGLAGLRRRTA